MENLIKIAYAKVRAQIKQYGFVALQYYFGKILVDPKILALMLKFLIL